MVAPMIGVRSEVPLLDTLSFDFRADVGGRQLEPHVGTDRRSPLLAPLGASGAQTWLDAGYRAVSFNQDFGGGNEVDLSSADLSWHGVRVLMPLSTSRGERGKALPHSVPATLGV